jgi:hypothetical protein
MRANWWGVASAAVAVAAYVITDFCLEHGPYMQPRIYNSTCYQLGFVLSLAALVGGVVAIRRGSLLWLPVVLVSGWMTLVGFLGEL